MSVKNALAYHCFIGLFPDFAISQKISLFFIKSLVVRFCGLTKKNYKTIKKSRDICVKVIKRS